MGSTKYLLSMGELSRKDNSLCFRKSTEKGCKPNYIPIENTKEIYCLQEVSVNSKLLDFLAHNGIVVHFFNYYGYYSGSFYPKENLVSGRLLISQVNAFQNRRIEVAKSIVLGIGKNIYEVLYHYYKHGNEEVKDTLDWIKKNLEEKLQQAGDIQSVMQVEGETWQRFYSNFKYILPEDFVFNKRVKRPPDNPINAMISFGNSMLYSSTVATIYNTHLDQRISFLHEPSEGRFSLSLDLSEVFKPIITFKVIFELVNTKKIKVSKHFNKDLNYCILNDEGKRVFIDAFKKRMESVFEHPRLKRKVSYKTAIKLDCYKLIKYILEEKQFKPFSIKEKV